MASEMDVFSNSGPALLTCVDWKCPHHRRSIAASLVQSTYILERDRQKNRHGSEALAPPWWESFHFKLDRTLVDNKDSSIFGAVFEFTPQGSVQNSMVNNAPKFVVAFRGTLTKKTTFFRDLSLDFDIIMNLLHESSRSETAIKAVREVVDSDVESSKIWLAGHSLGASLATLFSKGDVCLDTFLFNPPFVSPLNPFEKTKDQKVIWKLLAAGSVCKVWLYFMLMREHERADAEESFAMLSSWVPCLFVNRKDIISSGYISYFRLRDHMEKIGAGIIGRLATQNSLRALLLSAFGKKHEALHLLPSANLTINPRGRPDPHGIHQWWRPDLCLEDSSFKL